MDTEDYTYEIKHVVLPRFKRTIFRCKNCKTMFVSKKTYYKTEYRNEICPYCGRTMSAAEEIGLWEYNLIRWFRGDFKKTEDDKMKELIERINESGGEQAPRVRMITCSCCKFGMKRNGKTYECVKPNGNHGYSNDKDFYCKDGIDKSVNNSSEIYC